VHYVPKYIEVMPDDLNIQFQGEAEFEMDLMDAIVRWYNQMEMKLYRDKEIRRSRNFVESGFMESVVARCFDLKDAGNLRQLIGDRKDCDGTNYKSCQKNRIAMRPVHGIIWWGLQHDMGAKGPIIRLHSMVADWSATIGGERRSSARRCE